MLYLLKNIGVLHHRIHDYLSNLFLLYNADVLFHRKPTHHLYLNPTDFHEMWGVSRI